MGTYPIAIVGESFANDDGSSRQNEIARCRVGEPVELERDPGNPHDSLCVRVLSARGVQIGNIGRVDAWIAERIDAGRQVSATIQSIGKGERGLLGVVLSVDTGGGKQDYHDAEPLGSAVAVGAVEVADPKSRRDVPKPKPLTKGQRGCLGVVVVFFLLALLSSFLPDPDGSTNTTDDAAAEEDRVADAKAAADRHQGFHCLSSWDGSNRSTVEQIKRQLREPDSFEHDETKITPVLPGNKTHTLSMRYRARNGFGGMNVATALAAIDPASCEAEIISTGE